MDHFNFLYSHFLGSHYSGDGTDLITFSLILCMNARWLYCRLIVKCLWCCICATQLHSLIQKKDVDKFKAFVAILGHTSSQFSLNRFLPNVQKCLLFNFYPRSRSNNCNWFKRYFLDPWSLVWNDLIGSIQYLVVRSPQDYSRITIRIFRMRS